MKTCTKCKVEQSELNFHQNSVWCKLCKRIYKNKESARACELRERYGITLEQYDKMLADQGGVCAICKNKPKQRLCVDHDHETSKIRGLLCRKCNTGLGNFNDKLEMLTVAVEYLNRHYLQRG